MNTTTNYNLNLPEGSDLFAPLTDYNPNFTKIDTAMAENKNSAVHTATEAIAGTVHNITRDVPDASMFRWTATGNYTTGDTFAVDGVSVTAISANGQGLATGAWLTGTEVLASLVGNVMTVYTSAASTDAETLDGHPASYFGTATAVAQAQSDATAAGTLANAAQNRADQAYALAEAAGGLKLSTVWTNPTPTADFASQTVVLTNVPSDVKFFIIRIINGDYTSMGNGETVPAFWFSDTKFIDYPINFAARIGTRSITKSGGSVVFGNAIVYSSYGSQVTPATLNSYAKPLSIIAVS